MVTQSMLTTVDNPYSPFDQFDEWYAYDERMGYHSSSLLARVALVSDQMSDADYSIAIGNAIDEIIKENITGMFKKVTRDIPEELKQSA